jgi:hypothetical protein
MGQIRVCAHAAAEMISGSAAIFFVLRVQVQPTGRQKMTFDDCVNVHIDRAQCDLIDRWRRQHPLEPSRKAAVKALLKLGLRQVMKPATAKAAVPASTAPAESNQARSN